MDKSTLSNYGWIVIAVLVLAVMIALATPFGTYIQSGVENTTQGLFDTSEKAMNVVGMSAGNGSFDGDTGSSTPTIDHNGATIPEGATYRQADGTILNAGNNFPATVTHGDIYVYGDYAYAYNAETDIGWKVSLNEKYVADALALENYVTRNETEYGKILESINGLFVTDIYGLFKNCTSLTDLSDFAIPNSITDMSYTFHNCKSLTKSPKIPDSVITMWSTFENCTSLSVKPVIPSSVTTEDYRIFSGCTQLYS